jgi:hypothetical protein
MAGKEVVAERYAEVVVVTEDGVERGNLLLAFGD